MSGVNSELQKVPKGYKQTELGVIPEDWNISTVGNEFSIKLGKMLDAEKNSGVLKSYIGNRAVQWGRINVDAVELIKLTADDLKRYRLAKGDLLVCEGGEVGRAAIWEGQLSECYYQKALHRLRPSKSYCSLLLIYILEAYVKNNFIFNFVTQTSIAHLPKDKFQLVPLPLPKDKEQSAIANALSDVDTLITSLEKLIAKKRAIKTAAMQQLLTGKKRLPPFDTLNSKKGTSRYKQTELGEMPEDWDVTTIGEQTMWMSGGTPIRSTERYWQGSIPWISGSTLKSIEISTSDQFITPEAVLAGSKIAPIGSVLILVRGSALHNVIRAGMVVATVAFNQDVKALIPSKYLDPRFLTFYFLAKKCDFLKLVSSAGNSAGVLDTELIKNFKMHFPSIEEQVAIANILSEMGAEIDALEQRLNKTRQIKQGIMQELLTGRTRLI